MPGNFRHLCMVVLIVGCALSGHTAGDDAPQQLAAQLVNASGVSGGVIVQVGCGDGSLLPALAQQVPSLVLGLETDAAQVEAARKRLASLSNYGDITVDRWDGVRLPLADDLVTLVIADSPSAELAQEAMRVLAPLGVLMSRENGAWSKRVKPWPEDIDEWSHYLHDADNNAVAHDTRIGPPRSFQWIGSPLWSRHHDRIAAMSNLVTSAGRLFYIFDEGPTASIVLPSKWSLIARDAFNGVVLWKQPVPDWQTRMWPLKSGPAQLPRRLVASADTVFATLGINVPVTALDARTGETVRTYEGTKGTEEILLSNGVLFLLVDDTLEMDKYTQASEVNKPWWTGKTKKVMAVRADTGQILWQYESSVVPLTLTADDQSVWVHDGRLLVCLNREDGKVAWTSEAAPLARQIMSFFAPTLLVQDGVVLFAGGEESALVKSGGGATKADTVTAFDAGTGKVLWSAEHLPSGYSSPEDLFVIDGGVWYGGVSNPSLPGAVVGRDLHTGEIIKSYDAADVDTYWFHHRCYRGKATDKYMMVSRTGIEFIDPKTGHWDINHWTRGGCVYGIMPANGLIYTPPHDCICYPESKLFGFCALSAGGPDGARVELAGERHERGPAFDAYTSRQAPADPPGPGDWPTYRHDPQRTGSTNDALSAQLAEKWRADIGGELSAVTVSDGKIFVAAIDAHTVYAIDVNSGETVWRFVAGGRVDSPPTIHDGAAIFGCADGWVYAVRADDGQLIWRFRAAPQDTKIVSLEQLESRWPVPGSVLIQNNTVYAVAGRSLFTDGGMRLCRLDAKTGRLISEQTLDERDPETGEHMLSHTSRLTLPVALPDVLSSDGRHVYMRSQVFDMEGKRASISVDAEKLGSYAEVQEGETRHLFSPSGFLDGSWFHRSYWVYGRNFEGGWNSYYLAGRRVPYGKIMSVADGYAYGYGQQPQYLKWTTPMEFQLFSAPLDPHANKPPEDGKSSIIRVEKSSSLNPANKPVAVMAWVNSQKPGGVIVARGGGVLGYALFIENGVPHFTVSAENKRWDVAAANQLPAGWVHLAGVLTTDNKLIIYVNGAPAGAGDAGKLIPKDPADAMQIGADEGSAVGSYEAPFAFTGDIDDLRVYHGVVTEDDIRQLAAGTAGTVGDPSALVAHYTFDRGNAVDTSGNKNVGKVTGAESVAGKIGKAMRFFGRVSDEPATRVVYEWAKDVPILVRALAVTDKNLLIAGPEDLVDEPAALKTLEEPETREKLAAQTAALEGQSGAIMRLVARADGSTVAEFRMPTTPVWDGLAVAQGRAYFVGTDGVLRCYGEQ